MKFLKYLIHFTLAAFMLLAVNVHAENMKKMGSMNVHYMAIDATFLTPEVAKTYNIERSQYNALVNISVLDNTKLGTPAKTVSITGTAKNLLGQNKALEFVEVKEGHAIYYLAQMAHRNDETVHFKLKISDGKESHILSFSQKFYAD